MFDPLVNDLSHRYGLGDRGRELFGLLMAYMHNDRRGAFAGFAEGFREQGHGELFASWLGNPEADGLNASDVGTVFGQGLLNDWGGRLGVSRATIAAAIAGVLPRMVAALTPGGRMPGVLVAAPSLGADPAFPQAREPGYAARPGVDGLVPDGTPPATTPQNPEPDAPPPADPGRIVPAQARTTEAAPGFFDGPLPEPASQPLRREPVFAAETPPAVRSPVQARRDSEAAAPALDPAERRIAEMAAALSSDTRTAADAPIVADGRPPSWRPAVHPPKRKRGWGWLFWLVLLAALLAGAGWYAWTQGLLDPYIVQYQLPIRTFNPPPAS